MLAVQNLATRFAISVCSRLFNFQYNNLPLNQALCLTFSDIVDESCCVYTVPVAGARDGYDATWHCDVAASCPMHQPTSHLYYDSRRRGQLRLAFFTTTNVYEENQDTTELTNFRKQDDCALPSSVSSVSSAWCATLRNGIELIYNYRALPRATTALRLSGSSHPHT